MLRQHNLEGAYHRSLARGTPGARGLVLHLEVSRIERDERRLEREPWLSAVADISTTDAEVRRERGARAVHVPPFAYDESFLTLGGDRTTDGLSAVPGKRRPVLDDRGGAEAIHAGQG